MASKPGMASKIRYGQQDPVWPAKPGMASTPGSPNLPSHNGGPVSSQQLVGELVVEGEVLEPWSVLDVLPEH